MDVYNNLHLILLVALCFFAFPLDLRPDFDCWEEVTSYDNISNITKETTSYNNNTTSYSNGTNVRMFIYYVFLKSFMVFIRKGINHMFGSCKKNKASHWKDHLRNLNLLLDFCGTILLIVNFEANNCTGNIFSFSNILKYGIITFFMFSGPISSYLKRNQQEYVPTTQRDTLKEYFYYMGYYCIISNIVLFIYFILYILFYPFGLEPGYKISDTVVKLSTYSTHISQLILTVLVIIIIKILIFVGYAIIYDTVKSSSTAIHSNDSNNKIKRTTKEFVKFSMLFIFLTLLELSCACYIVYTVTFFENSDGQVIQFPGSIITRYFIDVVLIMISVTINYKRGEGTRLTTTMSTCETPV